MATDVDPIVDNWYQYLDIGQTFLVVAVDQESELVEVQHFDGDLEEITISNWYDLNIETSVAPENWSGPIDIAEVDDYGTEITETADKEWSEPLSTYKPTDAEKLTPDPDDSLEDQDEIIPDDKAELPELEALL